MRLWCRQTFELSTSEYEKLNAPAKKKKKIIYTVYIYIHIQNSQRLLCLGYKLLLQLQFLYSYLHFLYGDAKSRMLLFDENDVSA